MENVFGFSTFFFLQQTILNSNPLRPYIQDPLHLHRQSCYLLGRERAVKLQWEKSAKWHNLLS